MAERIDLDVREQQVLEAVSDLETRGETATIAAAARTTGLDPAQVEQALGTLTRENLVRERRVELDADATGSGREYTVRVS
jgi:DNA-binding IclR family transcriptional regulator